MAPTGRAALLKARIRTDEVSVEMCTGRQVLENARDSKGNEIVTVIMGQDVG
jgi:hypothetical protein